MWGCDPKVEQHSPSPSVQTHSHEGEEPTKPLSFNICDCVSEQYAASVCGVVNQIADVGKIYIGLRETSATV